MSDLELRGWWEHSYPPTVWAAPAPQSVASGAPFDPGAHTVDEVKAHVGAHPEQRDEVLDAELDGRNRVTLVNWLEEPMTPEEPTTPEEPDEPTEPDEG